MVRVLLPILVGLLALIQPAFALDPRVPAQRVPRISGDTAVDGSLTAGGSLAAPSICPLGGCDGSKVGIALPGGPSRMLWERAADIINVRDLAAGTCAGIATIDTAAMNAALVKAAAQPGSTIYLPACAWQFNVPASSTGFKVPTRTTVTGDGAGKTMIRWTDDDGKVLFGSTGTSGARATDIAFRNFTVRGTWDTRGNVEASAYPFLVSFVDGLTWTGVTSEYSRNMGIIARASTSVSAIGNTVRYAGRDGINFAECSNVTVNDNTVEHTDDDAIAVHSDTSDPWGVRKNIVVSGNRIFDAQGIKVLAARNTTISGNTLDAVKAFGISVATQSANGASFREGVSAAQAVSITGNVITNLINRKNIDNLNQNNPGILISGISARAGTAAAIPGEPNTAAGTVSDPYREFRANSGLPAVPTPGSYGIIVSGNVVARTLPATNGTDTRYTKWSDLGFGRIFVRGGWADPSLAESDLQDAGVTIENGVVRDVLIVNNIFRGLQTSLKVNNGTRFDNIVFRGNQVVDMSTWGLLVNTNAKLHLEIDENTFDIDPFLKHANRGPNGTWKVAGDPTAIWRQAGSGVFVRRNTFRNTVRDFNGDSSVPPAGWYFADNVVEADASVFNAFSTANRGVGLVRPNNATRYTRVGSDPASADFGTVLAMPGQASGTLVGRWNAGTGATESIAIGSGLSFAGGTLAAAIPSNLGASKVSSLSSVGGITITNNAIGYPNPTGGTGSFPAIAIGAPPAGGSQATAAVESMALWGFSLSGLKSTGSGYHVDDVLTFVGGTIGGASPRPITLRVRAVDGAGAITDWGGLDAGSYISLPPDEVTLSGGSGSGAVMSAGSTYRILTAVVTGGGSGYTSAPPVTFPIGQGGATTGTTSLGGPLTLEGPGGRVLSDATGLKLGTGTALAPSATSGQIMLPTVSGAPTGTPSGAGAAYAPVAVDTVNNRLCAYIGSAWRCASLN